MSEEIDEEAVPCPKCGGECRRNPRGLWRCTRCALLWRADELVRPPEELGAST